MWLFKTTKIELVKKIHNGDDIYTLYFKPLEKIDFIPWQHVLVSAPDVFIPKPLSIASSSNENVIIFGTKISNSKYKLSLLSMIPWEQTTIRWPLWDFTLKNSHENIVFLAQWIWITPFRWLIKQIESEKLVKNVTLIHVNKWIQIYKDEIWNLVNESFYINSSKDFNETLNQVLKRKANATYYISGAGSFVKSTFDTLIKSWVGKYDIKKDTFHWYN